MTVGTAERNKSPSWLKISTDYERASDNARLKLLPRIRDAHPNKGLVLPRIKE